MIYKLAFLLTACLLMAAAYHIGQSNREDRLSQSAFPCQEDQVLGFSPAFGPDRVGCMQVEHYGEIGTALSIEPID